MAKKVIIFDFDGTIADTTDSVVKILNHTAHRFGYKNLDIGTLRNRSSADVRKDYGLSIIKVFFILRKVRSELNKVIESLKPIKNLRDTLLKLKEKENILGILTSNSKKNVKKFIIKNNLDFFDFIYSEGSVYSKSKALGTLLNDKKLDPHKVIYVGDETRDIVAAKKAGINVIAVSWGFNTREVLLKHDPEFLIDKPEELINIFDKFK